jgi:hypothetical protein
MQACRRRAEAHDSPDAFAGPLRCPQPADCGLAIKSNSPGTENSRKFIKKNSRKDLPKEEEKRKLT